MRKQTKVLFGGSILALLLLFISDPSGGAITSTFGIGVITCIIAVLFAHICRKAVLDYSDADVSALFTKARETATGAGLALVAFAIIFSSLINLFSRSVSS